MKLTRHGCLHAARVYLAEAARRRNSEVDRKFYWTLLSWARHARLQAAGCPYQTELFA